MQTVRSPAAPERSRIYEKIISELLHERRYASIADLVADAKARCVELRLPYGHHEVDEALTAMRERLHREIVPASDRGTKPEVAHQPLTREEAATWLARIGAMVKAVPAARPKVVPNARSLTDREVDKREALRVVMQAIREQAQRCEDVER